jgi:hypothetical protein
MPRNGDPYFTRELRATVKDRAPFATTRYVSLSLSMVYNLTKYFRHITPKKLSATHPNSSSPKPRVVNSRTAAQTSNRKPTPTSSIVSPSTPQVSTAPTPSPPAVFSPAPTPPPKSTKSRTSALGRTQRASFPLPSSPNTPWSR